MNDEFVPKKLTCLRCGGSWWSKVDNPSGCARCKSVYWNKPRKVKDIKLKMHYGDDKDPSVTISYKENMTPCALSEALFNFLEIVLKDDGYKLKGDLYSLTEEI